MNILISSAGRRVGLVRAFQTDARALIPDCRVIASDQQPGLAAACLVADSSFRVPAAAASNYIDVLESECISRGISLVVPTIDSELQILAQAAQRLQAAGIALAISDSQLIAASSDKALTPGLFAQLDMRTPRAMAVEELEFPVFVKPRRGSGSLDVTLAHSHDDLTKNHLVNQRYIFQEYIDPAEFDEVTVDLYYDRAGNLKCLVPRLRIETRAGEVSKGRTLRDAIYPYLLKRLTQLPGARGCVTLQIFCNPNQSRILGIEINPRFGGGYPLSYAAGAHFPGWLIREYLLNERVPFFDEWESNLTMLRYDEGIFFSAVPD